MILYDNKNERSDRLQPYLSQADKEGRLLSVVTADPTKEKRALSLRDGRKKVPYLVHDARPLVEKYRAATTRFASFLREGQKVSMSKKFAGWTWIGDWEHLLYDRFDYVLDVERYVESRRLEPRMPSTWVCCFRNEGFCSLPLPQVMELFELHTAVAFKHVKF
jgi:hypothetical protein